MLKLSTISCENQSSSIVMEEEELAKILEILNPSREESDVFLVSTKGMKEMGD